MLKPGPRAARGWRGRLGGGEWIMLPLGLALGLATAYAIVADWKVAIIMLGLELALPVAIILHRRPFLAVLIWLALNQFLLTTEFLLPYRVAFWMFHRALPPATLGIILISAMLRVSPLRLPRLGLPELAMIGYLAASLLSIVLLGYTKLATSYRLYDRVFIPICLYLIARLAAPGERDYARLTAVACAICLAQVAIGALSWVMPGVLLDGWRSQVGERTIGSLINTSTYTSTLLFCGVLVLHAAVRLRPGPLRTLYMLSFALAVVFTFLSFSRASWIGGVLVLAGLCLIYPTSMLRLSMAALPVLVIGINIGVLSHQFSWASERLYSEQSTGSALDRLPAYFAAVRMFEIKPLFGWGYENFERFDRQFHQRVFDLANDNKDHANHNAYLTILAEQGAVGALLYVAPPLLLLARSIGRWRRRRAAGQPGEALLLLLWLALLNIFVQNNFTPAWVTYGLGLWWLIQGLIAGLISAPEQPGRALRANS